MCKTPIGETSIIFWVNQALNLGFQKFCFRDIGCYKKRDHDDI